jgi:hypothetical protein
VSATERHAERGEQLVHQDAIRGMVLATQADPPIFEISEVFQHALEA